jgi:sugar/nucleoside kinase (ribokinase family)
VSDPAILVIGDSMTDIIVMPEGPMVRGSDRRAVIRRRPGGSGANQAVWLGSMGANVRFASRVNEADRTGNEAYLRSHGVTPLLGGDPVAPSGVLVTIVDADGERSFLTDRGANLNLGSSDLAPTLLEGVGLVLVSGYTYFTPDPRAAVLELLKEARARGIATAVDPASVGFLREVGIEAFLNWTRGIDTIFANVDEASELSGSSQLTLQMQTLGRFFGRVVIKRGTAGAAIGDRNGVRLSLPAPSTDAVDTTGAGDAFAAAFLIHEIRGHSVEACLKAGIAAGAEAVTQIGGQPAEGHPGL